MGVGAGERAYLYKELVQSNVSRLSQLSPLYNKVTNTQF